MAKKKRYAQSSKDRMDESKGMKRRLDGYYDSSYRDQYGDGMIREDHSAPSNLPRYSIESEYPQFGHLDSDQARNGAYDTVRGIDRQIYDDSKQLSKNLKLENY